MLNLKLTVCLTTMILPLVVACSSSAPPPAQNSATTTDPSTAPTASPAGTASSSPNPILVPINRAKDAATTVKESGAKQEQETNKQN